MVSLKQRQSGFTIVELLIVIVIIGILATLVIVTFSGVQQKARDSERKTDINAIAGQLEAVYANKGYYPTYAEITDGTWRSTNEFRIDAKAFSDPKATGTGLQEKTASAPAAQGTDAFNYYYFPKPSGCASGACTGYEVWGYMEATSDPTKVYVRQSNN